MTIQIEEGKYYRTRDGRKAGPFRQRRVNEVEVTFGGPHEVFPWAANFPARYGGQDTVDTWQNCGLFTDFAHHPCDLVAEWVDEPAKPEQQKAEPGWKLDAGKDRIDLIAPEFIFGTARVLTFGAAKYAERNWEKGMSWGRCFGAMMRHLWAWWGGAGPTRKNFVFGELDDETGLSHLWHAACCLMFLVAYEERQIGTDDRKLPVDNASGL